MIHYIVILDSKSFFLPVSRQVCPESFWKNDTSKSFTTEVEEEAGSVRWIFSGVSQAARLYVLIWSSAKGPISLCKTKLAMLPLRCLRSFLLQIWSDMADPSVLHLKLQRCSHWFFFGQTEGFVGSKKKVELTVRVKVVLVFLSFPTSLYDFMTENLTLESEFFGHPPCMKGNLRLATATTGNKQIEFFLGSFKFFGCPMALLFSLKSGSSSPLPQERVVEDQIFAQRPRGDVVKLKFDEIGRLNWMNCWINQFIESTWYQFLSILSFQGARALFPKVLILSLAPSKKLLPTFLFPSQKKIWSIPSWLLLFQGNLRLLKKLLGRTCDGGETLHLPSSVVFFSEQNSPGHGPGKPQ